MDSTDPLAVAKALAVRAGKLCLKMAGQTGFSFKKDYSVVTEADIGSQKLITGALHKAFPGHHILAEEQIDDGNRDFRNLDRDQYLWIVDPLDGTDAYRMGLPTWGTGLALLHGNKTLLGVFYSPVSGELYWAGEKGPAYLGDREITAVKGKKLKPGVFLSVHSAFHRRYETTFPGKVRSLGSALYHQCLVARGSSSGAVVGGYIWDIAGGIHIARKAGAVVKYLDGRPLQLRPLLDGSRLKQRILVAPAPLWGKIREHISMIEKKKRER